MACSESVLMTLENHAALYAARIAGRGEASFTVRNRACNQFIWPGDLARPTLLSPCNEIILYVHQAESERQTDVRERFINFTDSKGEAFAGACAEKLARSPTSGTTNSSPSEPDRFCWAAEAIQSVTLKASKDFLWQRYVPAPQAVEGETTSGNPVKQCTARSPYRAKLTVATPTG
eukprot:scaffold151868_cov51-Prasinocladus_malaysianus.AAC.1